jgi:hypothetical protein
MLGSIGTGGGVLDGAEKELINRGLSSLSSECTFTNEGGFAIRLLNKTGAASVKGNLVDISDTTEGGVRLTPVDIPDTIGVFYESGVPDGSLAWIVVSGRAEVYFSGSATRRHLARSMITGDAGAAAGLAIAEALPTSPFATDKHFCEIGHVERSGTGAGLAFCILHFN